MRGSMIYYNRPKESVVSMMEESDYTFYLTGSRFFGGSNSKSDWDYFVEDSKEVRKFLENTGFWMMDKEDSTTTHYGDASMVALYSRNDIHIQVVKDAYLKHRAQAFLTRHANMKSVPKICRRHLWNMALNHVSEC